MPNVAETPDRWKLEDESQSSRSYRRDPEVGLFS